MPDLENAIPAGGSEAGKKPEDQAAVNPQAQPAPQGDPKPEDQGGPPPSNEERAKAKAEREAAEKAEAEAKAKAEAEGAEGDDDNDDGEDKELDTEVWGDAGDEVANATLETLQNSGVSVEEAKALLWDAVQAGDPSKVDRDALVEKVGKAKANLIMAGIENVTSRNNERIAEVTKIANDAAGGEDNWKAATAWARKNLDENTLNEYRDMLDAGGEKAKYASSQIVAKYNADPKNTALTAGAGALTPDEPGQSTVEPITRRQYGEQLDIL